MAQWRFLHPTPVVDVNLKGETVAPLRAGIEVLGIETIEEVNEDGS